MSREQSKYCYSGSDILINKENIQNQEELTIFEGLMTSARITRLKMQPILGNFDLDHLRHIHRYIFQDVYNFAGEIRNEDITKGRTLFALARFIEMNANSFFQQLLAENHLKGLSRELFAERAAHYMGEINALHPFREGNGRSQREFIRCLALINGFVLDWSIIDHDEVLIASIKSMDEISHLTDVIFRSITI